MATRRFRLALSTAYGQLILLVFLPISVLAIVGGFLVWQDTSRAARTVQHATADHLLSRYQVLATEQQTTLEQINQTLIPQVVQTKDNKTSPPLSAEQLATLQTALASQFQQTNADSHLQGFAIVNDYGQILLSFGDTVAVNNVKRQLSGLVMSDNSSQLSDTLAFDSTFTRNFTLHKTLFGQKSANNSPNSVATTGRLGDANSTSLYGKRMILGKPTLPNQASAVGVWLLVSIDNEPLQIARYQVLFALVVTALLTLLLLLLSLNVYARRWIAPIYEMRLHLQRTNANNLYKPMSIDSSGELNQLQQDLVKTLRRLHTSFQELKNHAEQTEDDLRLAFDEMEMQNISIRNARDAAVSASQTKSAFLANISHELRTPLNSIDGFINLLSRHGGLSAEQDLYVQTIRKSSAHLLALVNDVLDFSKIEAGKLVLDSHEFDLYASIYDVVDMLSPLSAEKGLRLAVIFYDDVPRQLMGDALRVKQVLTNLVNNAIKFTDNGEVVVRVSLDDTDDFINIAVQDTGRGISPEHQNVLFQSFSQGDPSITRQYGGTGLGLVISKQLTFLMGGTIGFFDNFSQTEDNPSAPAKGTTFWFNLPMRLTDAEQQRLLTQEPMWQLPSMVSALQGSSNEHLSLLVWIDHVATMQVLKGSLRALPIHLHTAQSLANLLEQLKESGSRWDWVIVDNNTSEDTTALLKQVRLHYAGKLALFGYQLNLDPDLLTRYQARPLYQPLDRRQLYQLLDSENAQQQEPTLPQWHGFRVLAVDDHPPNLLVLEALLAELGIEVVSVNSGFEAVDFIREQQSHADKAVDLIFMDIQMPKMSGSEATRRIRQLEQDSQNPASVPIIALTAHSLSDEKESLLASGIDDYVGKPINQAQLLQILQRWLGKNSENAQFATTQSPSSHTTLNQVALNQVPINQVPFNQTPLFNAPTANTSSAQDLPVSDPKAFDNPFTDGLAVIDWQDALNRVAGKPDLAVNLLVMLLDSVEQEKADLTQAWQTQDRKELAHIAHRILGASRYTGVPQLRHASQKLEDKCLLNITNVSPTQFAMLSPYYQALLTALDNLSQADLSAYPELKYARLKENDMAWKMI